MGIDGLLDSSGYFASSGDLTNRNLLNNGAMQVHQRGTSAAGITVSGYYTADRWRSVAITQGTWTQSVENDAPTGSGFSKSLKMLCTTADASPATVDSVILEQRIEGQNLQRIAKGTTSAKQLTASFWVKSNVTGTYILELSDEAGSRAVSASYSIGASATWERKTIIFPADTSGTLANDNTSALAFSFWLGAGPSFTSGTLQTTWASKVSANRVVGQVNLASATNNYWQITGVQLEIGSSNTSFEFKSYEQELDECQRYYWRSAVGGGVMGVGPASSTTAATVNVKFPKTMRLAPTALDYGAAVTDLRVNDLVAGTVLTVIARSSATNSEYAVIDCTVASGLTQYRLYVLGAQTGNGYIGLSADL